MKKFFYLLFLPLALFGADAANDLILTQVNSSNTGNTQRNVAPLSNAAVTDAATFRNALGTAFNQVIAKSANFTVTAAQNGAVFNVTTGASTITATMPTGAAGLFFVLRKADSGAGGVLTSPSTTGMFIAGHSTLIFWDTNTSAWLTRDWFGSENTSGALTISSGGTTQNITLTPTGSVMVGGPSSNSTVSAVTSNALTLSTVSGGNSVVLGATGAVGATAGGTNQNVTITPSGTGSIVINPSGGSVQAVGAQGFQIADGTNVGTTIQVDAYGTNGPAIMGRRSRGTGASPTAAQSNDTLAYFSGKGYGTSAFFGAAGLTVNAKENFTDSANGQYLSFTTVLAGTNTSLVPLFIDSNGALLTSTNNHNTVGAMSTTGSILAVRGVALTDPVSSGTVATAVANSFAAPTFAASSATTFSDVFNVYAAGPVAAGTNVTRTRPHTLGVVDATSASSSITGGFIVAATLGTTATSTGIGGGNINTGGTITSGGAVVVGTTISSYNGLATAGNGVASVQGAARVTAQTGANASVTTYTVGASDASFLVSANVNVTASTTHSFTTTCAYTDEGNVSRTLTFGFTQLSGATFLTAITNVTGTGPYESPQYHIRCKAATTITIATTGTFTSVTYNAEGAIVKVL